MKTSTKKEKVEQDDNEWLAEFQAALSPFWSARLEYQAARVPVVAVQRLQTKRG